MTQPTTITNTWNSILLPFWGTAVDDSLCLPLRTECARGLRRELGVSLSTHLFSLRLSKNWKSLNFRSCMVYMKKYMPVWKRCTNSIQRTSEKMNQSWGQCDVIQEGIQVEDEAKQRATQPCCPPIDDMWTHLYLTNIACCHIQQNGALRIGLPK